MSTADSSRPELDRPAAYEIRLAGHVGPELAGWFEGLSVTAEAAGTTLLVGFVADQAALHGVLRKIRDVGLPLLSVRHIMPDEPHPSRSSGEKA